MTNFRKSFPILSRQINGNPMVFFDNAATSQKPQAVIAAVDDFYTRHNANIHRGLNPLAEEATALYESARETLRIFINAKYRQEIIFTSGATASVNLIAQTWGRKNLCAGDRVVLSIIEHHANFVPWLQLRDELGIHLDIINLDSQGRLDLVHAQKLLKQRRVKLLAVSLGSNVLGNVEINRMKNLRAQARQRGIVVLVDAAQAVAHARLNVQKLNCDFLVFSGHKMYGLTGTGVLYGRKDLLDNMPAWQGGGGMIKWVSAVDFETDELPYKFEAGTPNISGVIGLAVAVNFINTVGFDTIIDAEKKLIKYFLAQTKKYSWLALHGPHSPVDRLAVFALTVNGVHAHDVADILGENGIIVRAGHHCAQPLHDYLRTQATLRASLNFYNTTKEIDLFFQKLSQIHQQFN